MEGTLMLERITRVAPLGLRFWDAVTNRFVTEGLQVTAIPRIDGTFFGQPANGLPNRSGVFIFHHLPGLLGAEQGMGDGPYWTTPPAQRDFIVTVQDAEKRFLPFKILASAPTRRLLNWSCPSGKPTPGLPLQPVGSIPLFSAAGRQPPGGLAVIRTMIATSGGGPAAWAMVEARCQNNLVARAIADADGRAVLYLPYPKFVSAAAGSNRPPLTTQSWPIDLSVFFSLSPPFPDIPDLCMLVDQARARPLKKLSPSTPLGRLTLKYGEELIVKTQTKSELFLR